MATIMDQLDTDHRNVALMMTLLERQLDAVHEMSNADFDLMHDVMRYMTHYPDRVHHPMEDLVFERIRSDDPEIRAEVDALLREHTGLLEKGRAFLEVLRSVVDGAMVERTALEEQGRDYVGFMRHHMTREDDGLFVRARESLKAEDWAAVAKAFEAQADPVFGPIVAEEFRSLLEHIRRNAADA